MWYYASIDYVFPVHKIQDEVISKNGKIHSESDNFTKVHLEILFLEVMYGCHNGLKIANTSKMDFKNWCTLFLCEVHDKNVSSMITTMQTTKSKFLQLYSTICDQFKLFAFRSVKQ